jgi:hypothetical protein
MKSQPVKPINAEFDDPMKLAAFNSAMKGKGVDISTLKYYNPIDQAIDLELDELEVLKRYHSAFTNFAASGIARPLTRQLTEADIGKNIQGTIIDWCSAHAYEGSKAIEDIQVNIQYTVLQVIHHALESLLHRIKFYFRFFSIGGFNSHNFDSSVH